MNNPAPQYNQEAEEGVLGAILVNPDIYLDVAPILHADDFFLERNKWVFQAIERASMANLPIDVVTVSDEMDKMGVGHEAGGMAFLTKLVANVASSINGPGYAAIVAEDGMRRRVVAAAGTIAKAAYNNATSVDQLRDEVEAAVMDALDRDITGGGVMTAKSAMSEHMAELYEVQAGRIVPVPTGLTDLDKLLNGGMRRKWMYIIGGRPGMGKSALLQTLNYNMIQRGMKCATFTLEMPSSQWITRMIAHDVGAGVHLFDRQAGLSEEHLKVYQANFPKIGDKLWFIDESSGLTIQGLHAKCKRLKRRYGLDVVFIDYLQLMTTSSKNRNMNRVAEIGEVARGLKALAKDLDIVIIAAAQINRQVESRSDKRPTLSDLRESGDMEQEAYGVMLLYRDEIYDPTSLKKGTAEIILVKHRNGETGAAVTAFLAQYGRFENVLLQTINLNQPPPPPAPRPIVTPAWQPAPTPVTELHRSRQEELFDDL